MVSSALPPVPIILLCRKGGIASLTRLMGTRFECLVPEDLDSAIAWLGDGMAASVVIDFDTPEDTLSELSERFPELAMVLVSPPDAPEGVLSRVNVAGAFGLVSREADVLPEALCERLESHWKERKGEISTVAELRAALRRMQEQIARVEAETVASGASIDPATELWDRQYLIERLEDELNRLNRYRIPFGMVAVDLPAQPESLEQAAADLLRDFVRRVDISARFDPGCLVVLCPSTDAEGMRIFPDRLRDAFRAASLPGAPSGSLPEPLRIAIVTLDEASLAANGAVPAGEALARLQEARAAARGGDPVVFWQPCPPK